MTAIRHHEPRPFVIPLSAKVASITRCQRCDEPTGCEAWAHYKLRGLFCSSGCTALALQEPGFRTAVGG